MIACLCEDVTVEELTDAIWRGYHDLESLKRFVGFGIGPCQGKQCVQLARELLAARGLDPGEGMTPRPPNHPAPLALLAQEEEDIED